MNPKVDWRIGEWAIPGLLVPETLLPVQFLDGRHADDPATRAVKRLMLAVLEDALRCLQSYILEPTGPARRAYAETLAWIADCGAHGPFAFETICEALDIESNFLRRGIQDWCLQISAGMNYGRLKRRSIGRTSGPLHPKRRRKRTQTGKAGFQKCRR